MAGMALYVENLTQHDMPEVANVLFYPCDSVNHLLVRRRTNKEQNLFKDLISVTLAVDHEDEDEDSLIKISLANKSSQLIPFLLERERVPPIGKFTTFFIVDLIRSHRTLCMKYHLLFPCNKHLSKKKC